MSIPLELWPKAGSVTFGIAFSEGRPDIWSSSEGASELIFARWDQKEDNPQNERRSRPRCVKKTQKTRCLPPPFDDPPTHPMAPPTPPTLLVTGQSETD